MGGVGSGTWPRYSSRYTTDEFPALDIRGPQRSGLIGPGQVQVESVASLTWTPCGFRRRETLVRLPGRRVR